MKKITEHDPNTSVDQHKKLYELINDPANIHDLIDVTSTSADR